MHSVLPSRNTVAILAAIVAATVILATVSASYSESVTRSIENTATEKLRTQTEATSALVSDSIEGRLTDIADNLMVISKGPVVQAGQFQAADPLLRTGLSITNDVADSYGIVDKHGTVVWSAVQIGTNPEYDSSLNGLYVGASKWFTSTANDRQQIISAVPEKMQGDGSSGDSPTAFVIAYPIFARGNESFIGTVFAHVPFQKINAYLLDLIKSRFADSKASLIDSQGNIIASSESSNLGHNIFDSKFQSSRIPQAVTDGTQRDSFLQFVKAGLAQNDTANTDVTLYGTSSSLAYTPVIVHGTRIMTVFSSIPHLFALDITSAIEQQRYVNAVMIIGIGISAIGASFVVLTWNKRLKLAVNAKTKELQAANERLKTNDKMQREFINIAAHELRTPIQPILTVTEILDISSNDPHLRDDDEIRGIKRRDMKMIARNAERLQHLSSDILDATKIESGTLVLYKEKLDLAEIIQEAASDARQYVDCNEVEIRVSVDGLDTNGIPLMLEADKHRLVQVLSNLLSNAAKFTEKGTITVSAQLENYGKDVRVSVRDSGAGIHPDIFPRLFEKFSSMTDRGSGTGLGLYISKAIIEAHGGRIWCENNSDSRGATFSFTLPVMRAANDGAQPLQPLDAAFRQPVNPDFATPRSNREESSVQ